MKILLATTNKGKIIEMKEALIGTKFIFLTPNELNVTESPHEEGDTFLDNAVQKAEFYHTKTGLPTIADDSGIVVEALANELGVHTRRWGAGPSASDEEWIRYFLERMSIETNKHAKFICTLAYIDEAQKLHTFTGECDGIITDQLESSYLPGLPISACFRPKGFNVVYSNMSLEEKNLCSHRGRALMKLKKHLLGGSL